MVMVKFKCPHCGDELQHNSPEENIGFNGEGTNPTLHVCNGCEKYFVLWVEAKTEVTVAKVEAPDV